MKKGKIQNIVVWVLIISTVLMITLGELAGKFPNPHVIYVIVTIIGILWIGCLIVLAL